jgi:hypothetical protein
MRYPAAFQPGDKVRVTYETTVAPNPLRFDRSATGQPLSAVRRPGSLTGITAVPTENVELVERAKPEWWPPQVGDVIQHSGNWGRGTVVNADPFLSNIGSFSVYRHYLHQPGGSVASFSLTNSDPNEWKLVLPSAHRKDSKS